MRFMLATLCQLVVAGMLLVNWAAVALGEEQSQTDPNRDVRREWHHLANGRTEFEVSDPAQVPRQLALAAEQTYCRHELFIEHDPIRFFVVKYRRFAIVVCVDGAHASHRLFDLSDRVNLEKPKLVELPFLDPDGFGTSSRPGWIGWTGETGMLQVVTGSDISCGKLRHTYRLGRSFAPFVLVRVEYTKDECGKVEWTTIWDASQSPFPTKEK